MSLVVSGMKKGFAFCFFLILGLSFLTATSLVASECQISFREENCSSLTKNEIEKEIKSYLLDNSLEPVLSDSQMEYEIGAVFEDHDESIVYTLGVLTQGKNFLITLFSIHNGWFGRTTRLMYMTTDIPPTPELFNDIISTAATLLPKAPSSYYVLIQKVENPSGEAKLQSWSVFDKHDCIDLLVITAEDQYEGTDFAVMPWPVE